MPDFFKNSLDNKLQFWLLLGSQQGRSHGFESGGGGQILLVYDVNELYAVKSY